MFEVKGKVGGAGGGSEKNIATSALIYNDAWGRRGHRN